MTANTTVEAAADQETLVFVLFACCIPVRGARRSVICDLQRRFFRFIPNGLYDILTEHRGETIDAIKSAYSGEFDEIIDGYFDFLEEHEFGFWCDEPQNFPDLDLTWDRPEAITNAIVDIDDESEHDYRLLFNELDGLGCKALELRFFCAKGLGELRTVLDECRTGRLRSIALVVGWSEELTPGALADLCRDHQRVESLVVHSAPESRRERLGGAVPLHYRQEVIGSAECCGQIHAKYLVTNIETFTEAQHHNTCLNRKISIDARGEIKNCPSMKRSFGSFGKVSMRSALADPEFKQLWNIHKDQIKVCRVCEFRYICTDCRAYLADPDDIYSKPAKCDYDPYTAQWASQT